MKNLVRRVKKIENQLRTGDDDNWAMKVAENSAFWERYNRPNDEALYKALERNTGEKRELEPLRFQTKQDIEEYPRELSEKYSSLEEYKKRPIDYGPLDRAIRKAELKRRRLKTE